MGRYEEKRAVLKEIVGGSGYGDQARLMASNMLQEIDRKELFEDILELLEEDEFQVSDRNGWGYICRYCGGNRPEHFDHCEMVAIKVRLKEAIEWIE